MSNNIKQDDPMYATKHIVLVGGGWYFLLLLLVFSWIATFIRMLIVGEFSFWPLGFFIGAVVVLHYIGIQLKKNGYIMPGEREEEKTDGQGS